MDTIQRFAITQAKTFLKIGKFQACSNDKDIFRDLLAKELLLKSWFGLSGPYLASHFIRQTFEQGLGVCRNPTYAFCIQFSGRSIMECRAGCGACCIAPSISTPLPAMPHGKPAGVRCAHLSDSNLCELFGKPERPPVCGAFTADLFVCGQSRDEALTLIAHLEDLTAA